MYNPLAKLRFAAPLAAAVLLAGCGVLDRDELLLRPSQYEERTHLSQIPNAAAWAAAPGLISAYRRPIFNGYEQRLNLVNPSYMPGDNQMVIRVRDNISVDTRLVFEEFTKWTGGLPQPFVNLSSGELIRGEDDLGPYFYAEHRAGVDTICVFGMRRLTGSDREIPAGGNVMDVLLRNCLRGSTEQALAPMLAGSLGYGPGTIGRDGRSRMISPLAGPGL